MPSSDSDVVTRAATFDHPGYTPAAAFRTRHVPPPHLLDPAAMVFPEPGAGLVNGEDDRREVEAPAAAPWRHVCALRMVAADRQTVLYGTGWLAGPRTVITAGHCLFLRPSDSSDRELPVHLRGPVRSVTVVPGLTGSREPFGHAESRDFEVAREWRAWGDPDADYGAIFLKDDRFAKIGCFGFGVAQPDMLLGLRLNLSGYPLDREDGTRQFFAGREVTSVVGARMYYETDTYGGQSGSPIWVSLNGERFVVGIHTRGHHHLSMNSGVRIVEKTFDRLREWKRR